MSTSRAAIPAILAALTAAVAACGGASQQATTQDRPASPGLWESQALGEEPAEPESAPPQNDFEPGQYYEDWPNVYEGARSGDAGVPWSMAPAPPPTGPASQRPHSALFGK